VAWSPSAADCEFSATTSTGCIAVYSSGQSGSKEEWMNGCMYAWMGQLSRLERPEYQQAKQTVVLICVVWLRAFDATSRYLFSYKPLSRLPIRSKSHDRISVHRSSASKAAFGPSNATAHLFTPSSFFLDRQALWTAGRLLHAMLRLLQNYLSLLAFW
jgi:hypothetical protein